MSQARHSDGEAVPAAAGRPGSWLRGLRRRRDAADDGATSGREPSLPPAAEPAAPPAPAPPPASRLRPQPEDDASVYPLF
ncbi:MULTISPECIES: hypothetical protein [unclassified Streptomyces]|uniref:hypothetical protein n=1 Tax=unclassified Streptomyces TaxID=2593676 RepID=UPI000378579D|nr:MULTISPECIES: hypothetical protein [unclassified Streptomyces]MYY01236.1 hypothetical protein [Streptomyces sp. SID4913]